MKSLKTAKTITLRLPPQDYAKATRLAKHNQLSINKLFIAAMNLLDRQDQQKRLFDDFTVIGDRAEDVDVEFGQAAQFEILEKS